MTNYITISEELAERMTVAKEDDGRMLLVWIVAMACCLRNT